jgi:hypothetical protein
VRAIIEAELILEEPSADRGLVTWFDARVLEGHDDDGDDRVVARARVARIHVGQAADLGESLHDVLDADSGDLEALYGVFFEGDWFAEQFSEGAGSDLLYVSEVTVDPGREGRNIELALVRRLCDTLGQGCEVAALPYESEAETERWQRLGFSITTPGQPAGYLHLPLGVRQARVVPDEDLSSYKIVANPPPGRDHH